MKKSLFKKQKGFTILEMIVVAGIFAVISGIVLFNYSNFNNRIVLTNMAYETALTIRQAQIFGVGVRGSSGEFDSPYGVFFKKIVGTEGADDFLFFRDFKENGWHKCEGVMDGSVCVCSGEAGDECTERQMFNRGIKIVELYTKKTMDGSCEDAGAEGMTITFKRPNPDAQIRNLNESGERVYAEIVLESPQGDREYVVVRSTGQISVGPDPDCSVTP